MQKFDNEILCANFVARLAKNKDEIMQAQKLRYNKLLLHFNENNKSDNGLDSSEYDDFCDHMIVIDTTINEVVGTYRLMRKEHLKFKDKFICEFEYDITNLRNKPEEILELGRAVVDDKYRNGVVLKLLWRLINEYCKHYNIKYLFGTVSFLGSDINKYKHAFSYLYYNYLDKEENLCYAYEPKYRLDILKPEEIDAVKVKEEMPPLVKFYLLMGCKVSYEAFYDEPFNDLSIMTVLDMTNKNERFLNRMIEV